MACNERVGKGIVTYPCTLADGHDGPHSSNESGPSQRERARWEEGQQAKATLASFQGEALTTAERYTENPTDVPITPGRARLHSVCSARECQVYDGDHSNRISAWRECPYKPGPPPGYRATRVEDVPGLDNVEQRAAAVFDRAEEQGSRIFIDPDTGQSWLHAEGRNEPVEVTPTKQREGDQVLPTKNDHPDIQSMVIADIEQRRQVGISRYGTALQPFNGRDMLLDAYEEAMDLCIYLKGVMVERDSR